MNDLSRVLLDAIMFLAIMPFVLPRLSGWLASHCFASVLLFGCCFCFAHSLNMVQPGVKKESKASVSRKKRKAQEKSRRLNQRRKAERKKETPEERELRLSKRRKKARSETAAKKAARLEKQRVINNQNQSQETEAERAARLEKQRIINNQNRSQETEAERAARLEKQRVINNQNQSQETEAERAARLEKQRIINNQNQSQETEAERAARLEKQRIIEKNKLEQETEAEKAARLEKQRVINKNCSKPKTLDLSSNSVPFAKNAMMASSGFRDVQPVCTFITVEKTIKCKIGHATKRSANCGGNAQTQPPAPANR